jgi:hypothetical protein
MVITSFVCDLLCLVSTSLANQSRDQIIETPLLTTIVLPLVRAFQLYGDNFDSAFVCGSTPVGVVRRVLRNISADRLNLIRIIPA